MITRFNRKRFECIKRDAQRKPHLRYENDESRDDNEEFARLLANAIHNHVEGSLSIDLKNEVHETSINGTVDLYHVAKIMLENIPVEWVIGRAKP